MSLPWSLPLRIPFLGILSTTTWPLCCRSSVIEDNQMSNFSIFQPDLCSLNTKLSLHFLNTSCNSSPLNVPRIWLEKRKQTHFNFYRMRRNSKGKNWHLLHTKLPRSLSRRPNLQMDYRSSPGKYNSVSLDEFST